MEPIAIFVNNESILTHKTILADFVTAQHPNNTGLAVAVNQTIIAKSDWDSYVLKPDDRVAIFQVVAGG